jgi:DNA repair exonuclease SbcCD ATPase subunit
MPGENPSEFRFDSDDQEPESYYHEELKDLRIEKLSQRVTLLTILLPCLIAVAIYFGYRNLSDSVSQSSDTGSLEIQRLTKELEDLSKNFNQKLITFSTTLSTQDKDIGTSIEGRLFAINKNIGALQHDFKSLNEDLKRDLKKNQNTIEKLMASKADKKSQAVAVEKINASIKPLKKELQKLKAMRQNLKTVSGNIKKLESKLTKKINAVTAKAEQVAKEYEQIGTSLTKLSGNTIDKDALAVALALERLKLSKNFENQLAEEVSDLNQRLESLQMEIDAIEKISDTQKQSLKKVSKKAVTRQSGTAPKTGAGSAALPAPPGTITEKDLIE